LTIPLHISYSIHKYLCLSLLGLAVLGFSQPLDGQSCEVTTLHAQAVEIPDRDTVVLRIFVSAADEADLGGFQSVCGVHVNFDHQKLSDLTFDMYSPFGDTVRLIGPAVVNGTQSSLFRINHDVTFISGITGAGGTGPNPDPPLQSPWTNIVFGWGARSSYGGIYVPFDGDFQDNMGGGFDRGPVTGIWELRVIDHFQNDLGNINSFGITFCDEDGLECGPCEAEAGSFDNPSDTTFICVGDTFDPHDIYTEGPTDTSLYEEVFIVYNAIGGPVERGVVPDFSGLRAGVYQVRSLNIIKSQLDSLTSSNFNLTTDNLSTLEQENDRVGGQFCMDLSDIAIVRIIEPTVVSESMDLCVGESIQFAGQTISTTGVYMDTLGRCDTISVMTITASDLEASFVSPTISTDCATGNALIVPNVIGGQGAITYEWRRGSDPAIISSADRLAVASADMWSVRIADQICDTTLTIESLVAGSGFTADLVASSNEINCGVPFSDLSLTANFSIDSIIWTRDGGFIARDTNMITVQNTGLYNADIYGGGGCLISESVTIESNFDRPDAQVIAPDISCANGGILATISTSDPLRFTTWLDQNGDTLSRGIELGVNNAGTFELRLIGENNCDTSIVFSVESDDVSPTVSDVPEGDFILDCALPSLSVVPTINPSEVAEEFWILGVQDTMRGPTGLMISEANTYRYVALGFNGCKTERRLDVSVDTLRPRLDVNLDVILDSITCTNTEAEIILTDLSPDFTVSFSGSNVIGQTDSSAFVDEPSFVDIILMDTRNQCSSDASVEVILADGVPNVIIDADSIITCQRPEAELQVTFPGTIPEEFFWTDPAGVRIDQQSIVVNDTGTYIFQAVGANGCDFSASRTISRNEETPNFTVPDQYVITCALDSIVLEVEDISLNDSVIWILGQDTITGPELSIASDRTSLELIVIGENGCPAGRVLDILYDTLPPEFELQSEALTCTQSTVEITTSVELDDHSFLWGGPDATGVTTPSIEVSLPGAYGLSVTNLANGCSELRTIEVMEDLSVPVYTALPVDVITCNQSSVNVSVEADTNDEIQWQTSDGRTVDGPKILASVRGFQKFTITSTNGCNAVDSVEVFSDIEKPRVVVEENYELSCDIDTIEITPNYIDIPESSIWMFSDGSRTLTPTQIITDDRLESLTVIGENGCQTEVTFNVTLALDIPIALINDSDSLSCGGESISINTAPPISSNHQIFWFRDDDLITSDITDIEATETGNYILQVIDTVSGCESSDTSFIRIASSPITNLILEKRDESCDGDNDGFVRISQINGGEGSVVLTVDGLPANIGEEIPLRPGVYEVMAEDEFGCDLANEIVIEPGGFIDLDAGPDISVERGDKVSIVPTVTGSPFVDIMWIGDQGTNEVGVDSLCFIPSVDETIVVTVTTENGCSAIDSLNIDVFVDVSKVSAFVPNILNLNSAIGNDVVTIDLPFDIVELTDFSIFDRWGQQVAYAPLISNGSPIIIWDGRMNGSEVESGVYVFNYEMLTIYDNRRRSRTGDITVIK